MWVDVGRHLHYPAPMQEDAVIRLERFKEQHPDVQVTPPGPQTGAFWKAVDQGAEVADGYWLTQLMDKLERKYS